jgi:hypothetical protein
VGVLLMKFLIPIACVVFVIICAVYLARRFFGDE